LSGEKKIGIMLNMMILPGFILVQIFFPDTLSFFSTTFGRVAILLVFISLLAGIILDRFQKNVNF